MSHVRRQIRDAVVARLQNLTTTGSRVYVSRTHSLSASDLPCLLVRSGSESFEDQDRGTVSYPRQRQRGYSVIIEAVAGLQNIDNQLDQMIAEVETAIGADITLGGVVKDISLDSIEQPELSGEGSGNYGSVVMTWGALYIAAENNPEISI